MHLAHKPWVVLVILPNCINNICPLAKAAATWSFQFSLLSTITPRNFADSFDGILWFPRTSAWHVIGFLSLGLRGFGTDFLLRSSNWNLLMPNLQLCLLAQSNTPSCLCMMSCSFVWVYAKSLPLIMMAVSSTNNSIVSPCRVLRIFRRSEL